MPRETRVRIHLYGDVAGSSAALPFDDAQKAAIADRLTRLFTSPPNLSQNNSFVCSFDFGDDIPGQSFQKGDGELLSDLQALGALTVPAGIWATRVLIAQSSTRPNPTRGVMFDLNGRQGCAVFIDAIRNSGLSHQKLLIRTIAHELGHVFNLAHEDSLGVRTQILFDPASRESIDGPEISNRCWEHLLQHDLDSVRPSSGIGFGRRTCDSQHPLSSFSGLSPSGSSGRTESGGVHLELEVAHGHVYPNPSQPTFVIGEPVHLALTVTNRSRRTVMVPRSPATATQEIIVQRIDPSGEKVTLSPPLLCCSAPWQRSWLPLNPGATARFRETLLFRNNELVFPREGNYRLVAGLRLRGQWVASEPVTVRVAPPLEKRHESSSAVAAEPEIGLFVELGGTILSGKARSQLADLHKTNPKFPLNPLVELLNSRQDVLADDRTPARSRERLAQLASSSQPKPLCTEAELLLLLERAQGGDQQAKLRLRRRLANEASLPIAPHTAYLIRRRMERT